MNMFVKATKKQLKLRLALDGPSGSGKTYTALMAATALADGGKVAVIDTERNSASLYSDKFSFDVACLDTFSPRSYIELIQGAEEAGYTVIVIDSLSHAWEGEGGVLDMHDNAVKRQKTENSFTAWKDVTPEHRKLVDAILQSGCHVVSTMRSKMEYVQEKDSNGRTSIKKVGMAPIQRAGIEYEFTVVGDMDVDHTLVISKSRMSAIADEVVKKPDVKWFGKISAWLNSGEAQQQAEAPKAESPAPVMALEQAGNRKTARGTRFADLTVEQMHVYLGWSQNPEDHKALDMLLASKSSEKQVEAPVEKQEAKPAENGKRADSQKPTDDDWGKWYALAAQAEDLHIDVKSYEPAPLATLGDLRAAYAAVSKLIKENQG